MSRKAIGRLWWLRLAGFLVRWWGCFLQFPAHLCANLLYFGGQIGNERHAIAGVLATQHPNGLVGRRGFRIALGALRGVTGVPLTSNLCGDNILGFFLSFSLSEPNGGWHKLDLFFLPNLLGLCRVRQWHRYGLRSGNIVARRPWC